jgi:hypothetical protein
MCAPRLFVITARDAARAIVIARGPSAWAHLIAWDTGRDAFDRGAWFHGRIYEEKCDLSPGGALFVYAAFKGRGLLTSYSQSYTAVSRPPWLFALALWPMHTTYGGGGRFVDDRHLVTRGTRAVHPDHAFDAKKLVVVSGPAEHHRSSGEVEGASWSGRDHAGRLIYTRGGRVYRRERRRDTELADFRGLPPDPQPAPRWATRKL